MLTSQPVRADDAEMEKDAILHMRLQEDLKRSLDDLRRQEPDLPTRSEMVRRLIQRAIEASAKKAKR